MPSAENACNVVRKEEKRRLAAKWHQQQPASSRWKKPPVDACTRRTTLSLSLLTHCLNMPLFVVVVFVCSLVNDVMTEVERERRTR